MKKANIFISSVQSEFAKERQMLCDYIRTDVLLGQFFIPFIFEETPELLEAITNYTNNQRRSNNVQSEYVSSIGSHPFA
mgnify:CR=1 FL=1